jgi:molybdate transport system ATP-binding protein
VSESEETMSESGATGGKPAQHRAKIYASFGALTVDVQLELHAPWTVLFGPSGCGKTTILRAIAGLLPKHRADQTTLQLERLTGNGPWQDISGMKPELRFIGYAPQAGALFPHMTVLENVAFSAAVAHNKPSGAGIVDAAMDLFGLHQLGSRMPRQLSGGEAQRVNLARAFARPNARLLLLDEPFTGLDRRQRDDLLSRMVAWTAQRGVPVLSVTHDVEEALLLDADVIRLDAGRIVAQGPARSVLVEEVRRMQQVLG